MSIENPGEMGTWERAAALMRGAHRIVAFTGAGVSAESGIPTYRDTAQGVWKHHDPEQVVQIEAFLRDPRPFWRFFQDVRYQVIAQARPNPGHHALAALERAGRLAAIVTQNIDGLHQLAGAHQVIELHGNTRVIRCRACRATYSMEEVQARLARELPPPCPACGGMLKPEVVFFGEALPEEALRRAVAAVDRCDLLLAIGSSLVVYPAALLPQRAAQGGAHLIIINKTPTSFDGIADLLLREASGAVLPRLAALAGAEGE